MGLFIIPRPQPGDSQSIKRASSAISAYRLDARTHAHTLSDDASPHVWALIALFSFGVIYQVVCDHFVRSGVIDQATIGLHFALVIPSLYYHHSNIQTALPFHALDEPTASFYLRTHRATGRGNLPRRGYHVLFSF